MTRLRIDDHHAHHWFFVPEQCGIKSREQHNDIWMGDYISSKRLTTVICRSLLYKWGHFCQWVDIWKENPKTRANIWNVFFMQKSSKIQQTFSIWCSTDGALKQTSIELSSANHRAISKYPLMFPFTIWHNQTTAIFVSFSHFLKQLWFITY